VHVLVIGGGVIGFAIARELAARGALVQVIEMRGPGLGATRASAGMLAPLIEGHIGALLQLGERSLSMYDQYVERLRQDSGCAIEYRRCGTLQVARGDDEAARLQGVAQALEARGVRHTFMDGAGVRRLEPGLAHDLRAGLLVPEHAYVKVGDLMAGLQTAATRHGEELIAGRADAIDAAGDQVTVRVNGRVVEGDAVVIAAGSWSAPLTSPPAPVHPIRGQLVHLRFARPPLSRIVWGEGCYLVPWQDGSLLVGATSENVGFDESATPSAVAALHRAAASDLPSAAGAGVQEVRVGLRPATSDELPLIGPSSTMPGVFYATGHFRNGILLTPLTAALVSELLIDGRPGKMLDLVRPSRFGL